MNSHMGKEHGNGLVQSVDSGEPEICVNLASLKTFKCRYRSTKLTCPPLLYSIQGQGKITRGMDSTALRVSISSGVKVCGPFDLGNLELGSRFDHLPSCSNNCSWFWLPDQQDVENVLHSVEMKAPATTEHHIRNSWVIILMLFPPHWAPFAYYWPLPTNKHRTLPARGRPCTHQTVVQHVQFQADTVLWLLGLQHHHIKYAGWSNSPMQAQELS